MQIYTEHFEKRFLKASEEFYQAEGVAITRDLEVEWKSCLLTLQIADCLKHVEQRLHEEGDRVLHYLDQSTRKPLIHILEVQLIQAHVDTVIAKGRKDALLFNQIGFEYLVEMARIEDLKRMYSLFSRVGALDKLKVSWNSYIKVSITYHCLIHSEFWNQHGHGPREGQDPCGGFTPVQSKAGLDIGTILRI